MKNTTSSDSDILTFCPESSRGRQIAGIVILVLGISQIPVAVRILLLVSRPESRIPGALVPAAAIVLLLLTLLLLGVHLLQYRRTLTIDRPAGTVRIKRRTLGVWSEKSWPLARFTGVEIVRLDRPMGRAGLKVPFWSVVLRCTGESLIVGEFRTQEEAQDCAGRISQFAGLPTRQRAADSALAAV
jgi:hypothetical protein